MERIICLVLGYAFGLIQTGYIVGKLNGLDIRDHGSGNAGTTNTLRTLGAKWGLVTLIGDILKCMAAVFVACTIFGNSCSEFLPLLKIYTAAGVVLGHDFPFYLGFRVGKGIAATGGLCFSFHPVTAAGSVIVFVLVFFTTHYVSLGSLLVYVGFIIELLVLGQSGAIPMAQGFLNEMYAVALVLTVVAFWRHRENIVRLLNGVERKTYLTKKDRETH